jgi:hypothetical protein
VSAVRLSGLDDVAPTIDVGLRRSELPGSPHGRGPGAGASSDRLAEVVVERVRRGLREHERTRSSQRLLAVPRPRVDDALAPRAATADADPGGLHGPEGGG